MMARALTEEQLSIWKDRIACQAASGLRVADFCQQESISVGNFYYRKRQLMGRGHDRGGSEVYPCRRRDTAACLVRSSSLAGVSRSCLDRDREGGWHPDSIATADMEAFELALAVCSGRSVASK